MCGIAGLLSTRYRPQEAGEAARRMADAMAVRGPDDHGLGLLSAGAWCGALSHRRLSVIDLSPDGHQPMTLASERLTLVYNGEIYNYRDVRRELEALGRRFSTATDTEVILHAYAVWGREALSRFSGMFAFAIWDERDHTLFVARDRFGVKPLYLAHTPTTFAFASEVRGLLASGAVQPSFNAATLPGFLRTGAVESDATLISGVVSLPSAHWGIWKNGDWKTERYWSLADSVLSGRRATADEVAHEFERAIVDELVSDAPLGVFLSGGIDSSAVVSTLVANGATNLRTVSLCFEDASLDERLYAETVANRFGTVHTSIPVAASSVAELLPNFAQLQDQPCIDGLNTFLVSRAAREAGLTVALSGLGGDELFAGYRTFRFAQQWDRWGPLASLVAAPLRRLVGRLAEPVIGGKPARLLSDVAGVADIYVIARDVFAPEQAVALMGVGCPSDEAARETRHVMRHVAPDRLDAVTAMTMFEVDNYLLDTTLRQADAMSMQVSLEVRVPLLNHRLAETVVAVPSTERLSDHEPKPLILRSLRQPLPNNIVHRPKGTFTLPYRHWLRVEYRALVEDLLFSPRTKARGLFDERAVATTWQRFLAGAPGYGWGKVWTLCVLEAWLRHYLDPA